MATLTQLVDAYVKVRAAVKDPALLFSGEAREPSLDTGAANPGATNPGTPGNPAPAAGAAEMPTWAYVAIGGGAALALVVAVKVIR